MDKNLYAGTDEDQGRTARDADRSRPQHATRAEAPAEGRKRSRLTSYPSARTSAGLGLPPMPHPAGSSDTSGLGTQPAPGPFLCAVYLEYAKAAGVNRRLAVALLLRADVLRRAVLERGLCLPRHGTHGLNEASGALPVCRANDPR
jgi:hypothetical protein